MAGKEGVAVVAGGVGVGGGFAEASGAATGGAVEAAAEEVPSVMASVVDVAGARSSHTPGGR